VTFMEWVTPVVDETIRALVKKKFMQDPVAGLPSSASPGLHHEHAPYAAFDGRDKSDASERLTRSTMWKRDIITVVSACAESARLMSSGVQVRPFTRFRVVIIASTSWNSIEQLATTNPAWPLASGR